MTTLVYSIETGIGIYTSGSIDGAIIAEEGEGQLEVPDGAVANRVQVDHATGIYMPYDPPPPPAQTIEQQRDALKAELSMYRYDVEIRGIPFVIDSGPYERGTFTVRTDRESRSLITGTLQSFPGNDEDHFVRWKMVEQFVTMDRTIFSRMAIEAFTHVRQCFVAESDVVDLIDNAGDVSGFDVEAEFQIAFDAQ